MYNRMVKRKFCGQFGKLAMLYYPDHSYKSAVHLFREEIRLTRGLRQEDPLGKGMATHSSILA